MRNPKEHVRNTQKNSVGAGFFLRTNPFKFDRADCNAATGRGAAGAQLSARLAGAPTHRHRNRRPSDWTSGQVFRVYTYTSCLACGSQTRYAIMKRERPQYSSLTKPRKTLLTSIWTRCYVRRAAWNLCGVSKK